MPEVWFIRHAESISNAGEPTSDYAAIPLSAKGRNQAEAFSLMFEAPVPPSRIITTCFLRTQQTAEPFVQHIPLAERGVWPLHEFIMLDPETCKETTKAQRKSRVDAYWKKADPNYLDGPGAETFTQFLSRVDLSLNLAKAPSDHKLTVVFCHGFVMRLIMLRLSNPDLNGNDLMQALQLPCNKFPIPELFTLKTETNDGRIRKVTSSGLPFI